MSALEGNLRRRPLTRQTKSDIVQHLWPVSGISRYGGYDLDWEPYFCYYQNQCEHALHEQGKHVLVRTHQHIVDIACKLEQDREGIKADLKVLFTTEDMLSNGDEILDNTVDLVARLCVMVNISAYKSTVDESAKFLWDTPNLKNSLRNCFTTTHELNDGNTRFEKTFTAFNMQRIANIEICWTDDLADHLRMVGDDDKKVAIFHHASFLRYQRDNPLFPAGLVDETLRTLALLFTRDTEQTRKWLQGLPASLIVDQKGLLRCKTLRLNDRQIGKFKFWHDRLIILKQSFDESRPSKLSQWWHDTRDGHLWYTFWIAVLVLSLTVFFGLVQSIEGALQVYRAYHPLSA
jgi:hypothetical protein